MKQFVKSTAVTAVQFSPSKEEKESLVKDPSGKTSYAPKLVLDCELRVSNGEYFVSKNVGAEVLVLREGDWLVNEAGKFYTLSDSDFKASFSEVKATKEKKKEE